MKIKSMQLFFKLLYTHQTMRLHLFNMVNEPLEERFLPIKVFNENSAWVALLVWDNDREILHGPFEVEKEFAVETILVIEDYKWAGGELYVYFKSGVDTCITGLHIGEVKFEKC